MTATLLLQERDSFEIPADVQSLADFRRWALSDVFPEKGRIDFISGRIEVDMSPEDLFCHGTLKSEIAGVLSYLVKRGKLGHLFIDSTRVSCPQAALSCEPDIVFVSRESIASGRVRLVPKASGLPGRYVEVEGAPDLVVEVVSDTSVEKDTRRLPLVYFRAGMREFWLADARSDRPTLVIHHRGPSAYVPADRDADGFQQSLVFGRRFRLDSTWEPQGYWSFDLRTENRGG
jgi:Uma2 family endonuclease